ncbi:MAG TPA: hypothetical protein PKL77_08580 [Candidatus Omnitrophota bacterium]|nr:hypothetical protein [Candidatus Omnitrophota bacterium]
MVTKSSGFCPFCGNKLIPSEARDGTVKFICASDSCMAIIEFSPLMFGKPISQDEAFRRINKKPEVKS